VRLHGLRRDPQLLCDCAIGETLGDELQYLPLAGSEFGELGRGARIADQEADQLAVDHAFAAAYALDCVRLLVPTTGTMLTEINSPLASASRLCGWDVVVEAEQVVGVVVALQFA
jgi:hypothetical protein